MAINTLIKSDLYRYSGKTNLKAFLHHFKNSEGFKFMVFLRLSQSYSKLNPIGFLSRFFYRRLTYKFGFQIPKSVKIGKGLVLMHTGHIIINSKSSFGSNCNIYPGVTVGTTFRGKDKGVPVIGNQVWIGSNSIIVGKITIGNNVLIAPNSFVNKSVPDNSIVLGNPAVIKPRDNATADYIFNMV